MTPNAPNAPLVTTTQESLVPQHVELVLEAVSNASQQEIAQIVSLHFGRTVWYVNHARTTVSSAAVICYVSRVW